MPNLFVSKDGKGKGGDKSQMTCFAWRDHGKCDKKDAGTCQYNRPKSAKGVGKGGGGKKGDPKGSSSKGAREGKSGDGDTKGRSASPKRTVETDLAKCCKFYFKGECKKGKDCKMHHNGPCKFFASGNCTKGDQCVFTHWDAKKTAAVVKPEATAKKKAKAGDIDPG